MATSNSGWMVLGRWGALCAFGVFGAVVGLLGGFQLSSHYWASVGPLQTDVLACRTIVDIFEAVSADDAAAARQKISPHAYLCAIRLDETYGYLEPALQDAVAEDLRTLAALIAKDATFSPEVQRATLERLEKYAD